MDVKNFKNKMYKDMYSERQSKKREKKIMLHALEQE